LGGSGGSVIPPFYSDFLRENLFPNLYFRQLGTGVTIPRGFGDKIKIPRWDTPIQSWTGQAKLSTSDGIVTAVAENITEGAIISALGLSAEDITGNVVQFAGARSYTDKLIVVTKANYLEGALESLGRELAYRFDRYTRKNISANSTLRIAGGSTKAGSADTLIGKNIARIGPYLDANNVPRWEDEHFVAVTNPLVQFDLYKDVSSTGFVSVYRYHNPSNIYRGEVGSMYGIRLLCSNNIQKVVSDGSTSGTDGLSGTVTGSAAWVFGPDSFYSIELEGGGLEVIHQPPGSGGSTGDPAAQRGSIAVKAFYGVTPAPSVDQRLMRFAHAISLGY
jgi:N4-gp56 family major capsid protein